VRPHRRIGHLQHQRRGAAVTDAEVCVALVGARPTISSDVDDSGERV
jgi:hypothetical protein